MKINSLVIIPAVLLAATYLVFSSCGNVENGAKAPVQTENKAATAQTVMVNQPVDLDSTLAVAKTMENMQASYKGEVTATAKYAAFAKRAEQDGFHNVALLYNAISASENIHATNHKAVITDGGQTVPVIKPEFTVKSTKENLDKDINGEAYEAKTMYPLFLKTAETAGNDMAYLSLNYAMKTEKKHKFFFEQALGDINTKTLNSLPHTYFVCPACGNTYTTAPKHCDFSLTDREKFMKFQ
jgi:rubrerythrin